MSRNPPLDHNRENDLIRRMKSGDRADLRVRLGPPSDPPAPDWIKERLEGQLERSMLLDGSTGGRATSVGMGSTGIVVAIIAFFGVVGGIILWSLLSVGGVWGTSGGVNLLTSTRDPQPAQPSMAATPVPPALPLPNPAPVVEEAAKIQPPRKEYTLPWSVDWATAMGQSFAPDDAVPIPRRPKHPPLR